MKQQRAPLQSLDADLDYKITQLAEGKGIRTVVKPGKPAEQGLVPLTRHAPRLKPTTRPAPRTPMRNVNVELPAYVWKAVKIRAAER
jgi:hypothetical protein